MSDDNTFDIIQSRRAIPSTTRKIDGFSRQDVVNAFQRAFTMIGGVQRLALWANENPGDFFKLYAKMMPSTSINFGDNSVVQIVHAIGPTPLDVHPGGDGQVEGRLREDMDGLPNSADVQRGGEDGYLSVDRNTLG